MGDNHEGTMLQILKDLVKGQMRHPRDRQRQQGSNNKLEALTGGPNGSHWGDIIHTKSRNNHTPTQSRSLNIPRPLLPQFLTGQPTEEHEQPDQGIDINTSYREYEMIDEDIHEKFSYNDFCDLKHKYIPREGNKGTQRAHKTLTSCTRWEG
jgi:hypothetical protein